jgi:hypothetical protein
VISEDSTLLVVDDGFDFAPINLMAEEEITLRFYENATETWEGYIWEPLPIETQLLCVDLLDSNYDSFNTLYSQWHFKAKNLTETCIDYVNLTRIGTGLVDMVTVEVQMGRCPLLVGDDECSVEEIQNLDISSCLCEPMAVTYGRVFDSLIDIGDDTFAFYRNMTGD